jgi:hypothetical protein
MSRWNRDPDEIRADIAYAVGEDLDIVEYLRQHHRAAGWSGGDDV